MTGIDVAIPTLNAGAYFAGVLDAVRSQRGVGDVRVTAVDSQSDDETCDIARAAGARVVTVGRSRFNHGLTRNYSIEQTTGDVAILMTQDALPAHDNVFASLLEHFADPRVAGVCGRQVPRPDVGAIANARWQRLNRTSLETHVQVLGDRDWAALSPAERMQLAAFDNVCSAVRRSTWQRIPFRSVPFAEDRLWARDVILAGLAVVYEPRAEIVHSHAPGLRADLARIHVNHMMMRRAFGWEPAASGTDLVLDTARATVVCALEALSAPGRQSLASRLIATATAPFVETLRAIWGWGGSCRGLRLGPL